MGLGYYPLMAQLSNSKEALTRRPRLSIIQGETAGAHSLGLATKGVVVALKTAYTIRPSQSFDSLKWQNII